MLQSFDEVIDANYENLYRYAVSLCRSRDTAWDLTQESFLIWARKGSSIRSRGAPKSWLYTTLYREFLKLVRHSKRHEAIESEDMLEDAEPASLKEIEALDSAVVMQLLSELKIEYRSVVSLHYLESCSYKEIAKILDIPIGTVMSRLSRGKDLLRKRFKAADTKRTIVEFNNMGRGKRYG